MLGIILAVGFVIAAVIAIRMRLDPDVTRLDGVSPAVRQAEEDFSKTWSKSAKQMGMLVVTGKTQEEAEELNDAVAAKAASDPAAGLVSLSEFWPSATTRAANWARWRAFWTPQRIEQFKKDLTAAGEPYGFSAEAFEPFLNSLTTQPRGDRPHQIIQALEDQFVADHTATGRC